MIFFRNDADAYNLERFPHYRDGVATSAKSGKYRYLHLESFVWADGAFKDIPANLWDRNLAFAEKLQRHL